MQIEYNLINLPQSISNGNSSTTYYGYLVITTEQYVAKRQGDINNNDRTREDHKGNIKILTSKDYVSIFGSGTPQKVNDENNYLILIYSNNIDVDPGYPLNVIPTERSDESSVRQHKQR